MAKLGIAERMAWSIVAVPAVERKRVNQLIECCFILSTIEEKMSDFFRSKCSGSPRYLPTPLSLMMPKASLTLVLTSGGVFEENVIDVLSGLIF